MDLSFSDPCIVFALRRESVPFLREFRPHQRFPGCPVWGRFCGPAWLSVFVMETGMGAESAQRALSWLLAGPPLDGVAYRPKVVIAAGFAGALQERFRVGDVILATEVVDSDGTRYPTTWPGELPPGEWRPPLHRTAVLTASGLVTGVEEKRRLGELHNAGVVDMESATVARLCRDAGVPFGCVRAVSDDVNTPLSPRLAEVLAGGRVSVWKLITTVLRSPGLIGEMRRLGKNTDLAARQMGTALGELLTLTLPWSAGG